MYRVSDLPSLVNARAGVTNTGVKSEPSIRMSAAAAHARLAALRPTRERRVPRTMSTPPIFTASSKPRSCRTATLRTKPSPRPDSMAFARAPTLRRAPSVFMDVKDCTSL